MGEVAAAHVAGVLSLEDAVRVICRRSRLLRRARGKGAMAAVDLGPAEAARALAGYEDRLSVAVSNSSRSTVISGDPSALDELLERLEGQDVFCRRVKVDVASHSPQMDALRADLVRALEAVRPRSGTLPLYSTVTGEVAEGAGMDASYWARNLRQPVLFVNAVQRLAHDGHGAFVEVSPHPILLPALQQELREVGREAVVLPSLRREEGERATMLESLGWLYATGGAPNWEALHPSGGKAVPFFSYPWQRERFWYDETLAAGSQALPSIAPRPADGHPLLGRHVSSSVQPGTHFWLATLDTRLLPFLEDHRVGEQVVFPAAAYAEMALGAAREVFGAKPLVLRGLEIETALPLSGKGAIVQLVMSLETAGKGSFRILSLHAADETPAAEWTLHARGTVEAEEARSADDAAAERLSPAEVHARIGAESSSERHYEALAARGLRYGPRFRAVERAWSGGGEILGHVGRVEAGHAGSGGFQVHPVVLDAALQLLVAALPGPPGGIDPEDTFLPVALGSLTLLRRPRPDAGLWAHGYLRPQGAGDGDAFEGDVSLFDEEGQLLIAVQGLRLRRLEREAGGAEDCFFAVDWEEPAVAPVPSEPAEPPGRWLVLAGGNDAGRRLARLLRERGAECVMASPGPSYENPERD